MTLPPLSLEQKQVVDFLNLNDDHAFITGKAGAGKTHVLRWFQKLTNKNIAICAPTGIAALNASGSTIHNLLGLGTGLPATDGVDLFRVRSKRRWMKSLDTLVIDEISMVNADLMDSIDEMLQSIRQNREPFGGVQVVMFGDLYQLPPVVTKDDAKYFRDQGYRSEWFFDSNVWQTSTFETFQLEEIHRQTDPTFINLLNGVRDGSITDKEIHLLNALGRRPGMTEKALLLGARRYTVQEENHHKLTKLKGSRMLYEARVNKGFGMVEPADRKLYIKRGARIMMLSNDTTDRWVNGSLGVVTDFSKDHINVELDDGMEHIVDRAAWVRAGTHPDDYATAPKFWQFPIKLAWAVTIHKSQGLSLPEVNIDMGTGAFSPGQTYVALSRAMTPDGLYLKSPLTPADIRVDPNVRRFFDSL